LGTSRVFCLEFGSLSIPLFILAPLENVLTRQSLVFNSALANSVLLVSL
jgi:hypothetical protein